MFIKINYFGCVFSGNINYFNCCFKDIENWRFYQFSEFVIEFYCRNLIYNYCGYERLKRELGIEGFSEVKGFEKYV